MHKDLFRLIKILHIFLKARIDVDIEAFNKPKLLKLFFLISPWKLYSSKEDRGNRIKKALEESGPIFIKFGQLLSTRPDAIPSDIAKTLKSLQDDLPPFPTDQATSLIEKEMGSLIGDTFSDFDNQPIAAASIAQVYSANLIDGDDPVAIKVVRPGIKKVIERDISLMKRLSLIHI